MDPHPSPRAWGPLPSDAEPLAGSFRDVKIFKVWFQLAGARHRRLEADPRLRKSESLRGQGASPEQGQRRPGSCGRPAGRRCLVGLSLYSGGWGQCQVHAPCGPDVRRERESSSNKAVLQASAECLGLGPMAPTQLKGTAGERAPVGTHRNLPSLSAGAACSPHRLGLSRVCLINIFQVQKP